MEAKKTTKTQTTAKRVRAEQRPVAGTEEARKRASMLLEVWSGTASPSTAQEQLKISSMTYYALEHRALEAMVTAMEPLQKGRRGRRPRQEQGEALKKENERLERELRRQASLLRLARRTWGMKTPEATPKNGKRRRKSKPRTRKLLLRLKTPPAKAEAKAEA